MNTNLRRTFCLLLLFALLIPGVAMLASCTKVESVDLASYRVVYAYDLSGVTLKSKIEAFTDALNEKTGLSLRSVNDKQQEEEYEILIGVSNRAASLDAAVKIEGDGYAICKIGNKIAIVGTSSVLTILALDTFLEACFPNNDAAKSSVVSVPKKLVKSNVEMVEVDKNFTFIYSSNLDDKKGNDYDNTVTIAANPNAYDYPVQATYDLREMVAGILNEKESSLKVTDDIITELPKEITVGKTKRSISNELLAQLDAHTYGVLVKGNKISVCGTNDAGVRAAISLFKSLAELCKQSNETGGTVIRFPAEMTWIAERNIGWFSDFPRPEGEEISLANTLDVADGSGAYYYTGAGVNAEAYNRYCESLKTAGYSVYMENTIGESRFITFVNQEKNATLHVSYEAFEYASAQNVKTFVPTISIVSSFLDKVNLIDEQLLDANQTYTKVTESKITSMRLAFKSDNSVYGNAYVFLLEDGSMVVYDGGMTSTTDTTRLYNLMRDLHRQAFGELPSASKPLTVAAWYLSHGHGDHYGNFVAVCEKYGSAIVVERLLANFTSDEEDYNAYNPSNYVRDHIMQLERLTQNGMEYIKVHTGQKFYLRNIEIEVLYTHEDLGEVRYHYFNDSSTVLRTTFYSTDGNGNRQGVPTTAIWLGDLYKNGSKFLRAMYGDYLSSDMVQLAHHGFQGCEIALYRLISPTCVWWPSSYDFYRTASNPNSSNETYRINSVVAHELESVAYIIVQDSYNTTVTITKDGADYRLQSESETGLYNSGLTENGASENDVNPILQYGGSVIKK